VITAVLLHRWGVFAVRRRRTVLTVWLLAVAAVAALRRTLAAAAAVPGVTAGDPLAVPAITFGSLLSAGMPLVTALIAVVASMAGLMGLSSVVGISDRAPTLAVMLGLAVGIDYALFIVSRHRTELARGRSAREAAARATATAGGAVAFAGLTVIIAVGRADGRRGSGADVVAAAPTGQVASRPGC
jgi:uncharacterized membrane protein YdfJ with MMPL/SSD domain